MTKDRLLNVGDTVLYTGDLFPKYHGKTFEIGAIKTINNKNTTEHIVHLLDKEDTYFIEDGSIDYLRFMVGINDVKRVNA